MKSLLKVNLINADAIGFKLKPALSFFKEFLRVQREIVLLKTETGP